jgi:hypothetical protein
MSKHFKVDGRFNVEFSKIVAARTDAEAIRRARDMVLNRRKIKKSDFEKDSASAISLD